MDRVRENQGRGHAGISGGLRFAGIILALTLLVCAPAFSQISVGRISGAVTDPSGAVVAGATVTIVNTGTNVTHTLTADASGAYVAAALDPGTYTVSASSTGFKVSTHTGVVVQVGVDTRVDLSMEIGETSQSVSVSEQVPLVDTTDAVVGGTLTDTAINNLPLNGRNYQLLSTLRPGQMIYPGGGPNQQSSNGQAPTATAYFVDGLVDVDYNNGRTVMNYGSPLTDASTVLPIDAIQEFNLEQNPKAEYGWLTGGVINVGIKTGTNNLHGSAYGFGRDGSWDARNFFNPKPLPNANDGVSLENWGGSLGGPILKNKLFFFGAFEERRDALANEFVLGIPETVSQVTGANSSGDPTNSIPDAEAELTRLHVPISPVSLSLIKLYPANTANSPSQSIGFPNTDLTDNGIGKISYNLNEKNTITGMFFRSVYLGVGEDRPTANADWLARVPMSVWVSSDTWVWTPNSRWVNQAIFGFNRLFQGRFSDSSRNSTFYGIDTGVNPALVGEGGLPVINISGFVNMGSLTTPSSVGNDPVYDGQDTVSYVRGNHVFKFGFEMAHLAADSCCTASGKGSITFGGGVAFPTGGYDPSKPLAFDLQSSALEDFLSGNVTNPATIGVGDGRRHIHGWMFGGFGQDDWRLTPKLTVNVGMRYEYWTPPTEENGKLGTFSPVFGMLQYGQPGFTQLFKPNRDGFSPRVGVAYDFTGNSKTVFRAGAALTFNHPTYGTFAAAGVVPTGFLLNGVAGGGTINNGTVSTPVTVGEWNSVVFPNLALTPACTTAKRCSITFIDPNFRDPKIVKYNMGIQHQITSTLGLDVNYVGEYGADLVSTNDINAPIRPLINSTSATCGQACAGPFAGQFPYLFHITEDVTRSESFYNGLQVQFEQHASHGLSFLAGYTYSHVVNDSSKPDNGYNLTNEWGNADFDLRHRLTLTTTWDIPAPHFDSHRLLTGWQLNSIATLESGLPWVPTSPGNVSGFANSDISETGELIDPWDLFGQASDFTTTFNAYPYCSGTFDNAGDIKCFSYQSSLASPTQTQLTGPQTAAAFTLCTEHDPSITTLNKFGCYISTNGRSVMVPPASGTNGNIRRNSFRDSGFRNWDFSVFKNTKITERINAQFRAEFFNVLNHPELENPYGGNATNGTGTNSPTAGPNQFGCACATPDVGGGNPIVGSGGPRAIQLGLNITF